MSESVCKGICGCVPIRECIDFVGDRNCECVPICVSICGGQGRTEELLQGWLTVWTLGGGFSFGKLSIGSKHLLGSGWT